jgi:predicted dehydrogenase
MGIADTFRTLAVNLAIVGLGYWGPNILRNAWELEDAVVAAICDKDEEAVARQARRYGTTKLLTAFDDVLADEDIDGVCIVTPISTHYELAKTALLAGKHVFVEKPMASSVKECDELIEIAGERGLVLMPGHTFLYSPPVIATKERLESGEIGKLYFGTSSRVNLGIHQRDVSVVRDLAPHDFSILLYWLGQPSFLRGIARDTIVPGTFDVAFIDVGYENGTLIHLELSWLAPTKLRRTVLVGSEKMIVYEDTNPEQVRVFDRGVEIVEPKSFGEFQLSYRTGDVLTPRLAPNEPLRVELEDFVTAIRDGTEPRSNMQLGRDVVQMVEATELSLSFNCAPVPFEVPEGENRRLPDRRRSFGMPVLRPPRAAE